MSLTLPPSADSGAIVRETVIADKATGQTVVIEMGVADGKVFAFAIGDLVLSNEGLTRVYDAITRLKALAVKAEYAIAAEKV